MDLTKQVCSLELSKQLKEAGYEQEGLWWWWNIVDNKVWKDKPKPFLSSNPKSCFSTKEWENKHIQENYKFVAPTVAELGKKLGYENIPVINRYSYDKWICSKPEFHWTEFADTEANARASMILYLIKEKLL